MSSAYCAHTASSRGQIRSRFSATRLTNLAKLALAICLAILDFSAGDACYGRHVVERFCSSCQGLAVSEMPHHVQMLPRSQADHTRDSLLKIAKDPNAQIESREAAVTALSKFTDSETSRALASLLLPQTPLSLRLSIASHLHDSRCDQSCVQSILLYLERDWRGEPNLEDGTRNPEVALEIKGQQNRMRKELYDDLLESRREMGEVLVAYFGLGSPVPSSFGLHVVSDLKLADSCAELELSSRVSSNSALKSQVDSIMHNLGCKQTMPPLYAPK